jgi:hypothetical protein
MFWTRHGLRILELRALDDSVKVSLFFGGLVGGAVAFGATVFSLFFRDY